MFFSILVGEPLGSRRIPTRYLPQSYIVLSPGENSVDQEYGLKQALLAHGLWRTYYVDKGTAYTARSLRAI